ncbi:hypothetical protein [Actinomadura rubrisoli]|uniref:Uncharacterized protein n=1 Tax=Actinomadura rubrisoli TaxID=2530368 RepID=A0A4R5CHC1_9ACTN|nr:hypothetical protein [Actinomadura rubrisoli]TDD97703.1 hypothetical protein E1298_01315 [Actinomadura rubrisoli]
MAVEYTRPVVPAEDEQVIAQAMAVWDALTPGEQREVFRSLAQVVTRYGRTKDVDALTRFAESVDGMVRLESTTDLRRAIRETRGAPGKPAEVSFADMARQLEE